MIDCHVYKLTTDDWYPSYWIDDAMVVKVSFLSLIGDEWRVCVWGKDDTGREKDFDNQSDALDCFVEVIKLNNVTRDALKKLGFVSA